MSVKKSDLVKAIERFDAEIGKHQQEIAALETSKAIVEDVLREKTQKAKKVVAEAKKRAPRKPRTVETADASAEPMLASL